jgi:hypothetical protein
MVEPMKIPIQMADLDRMEVMAPTAPRYGAHAHRCHAAMPSGSKRHISKKLAKRSFK